MHENLFLNYNFVKGAQKFMKEAGLLKYADAAMEDTDANALAAAMADQGMDAHAESAMDENSVLEIANALLSMAQTQEPEKKEKLEEAAKEVAEAVAPAKMEEAKKEAAQVAEKFKKAAESDITNPKPDQVLSVSNTNYLREKGQTTLDTAKGEIGTLDNQEGKLKEKEAPDAKEHQVVESKDLTKKDYTSPGGVGGTALKTEGGEIGKEEKAKMAQLAIESAIAKILGK